MKDKDTRRRDSDLVEPSNSHRSIWVNNAGEPVEWVSKQVFITDWFHKRAVAFGEEISAEHSQGGRDIGIGEGPKSIFFPKVTIEVKVPTAEENAARLPPALGEALLVLFCPKNRAKHVMGDLEEIFHEDIKTKGKSRAVLLYWSGVLRSIGPQLWVKVRKAGLIALLVKIGRGWSGLS